jgi:hypothetical protein
MSVFVSAMSGIAFWHVAILVLDSIETKLRSTRRVSDLAPPSWLAPEFSNTWGPVVVAEPRLVRILRPPRCSPPPIAGRLARADD